MSYFPYPNISGTAEEQLRQIKSFLYQLVDRLNYSPAGAAAPSETYEKGDTNGED